LSQNPDFQNIEKTNKQTKSCSYDGPGAALAAKYNTTPS
jgi:hypothetical protein